LKAPSLLLSVCPQLQSPNKHRHSPNYGISLCRGSHACQGRWPSLDSRLESDLAELGEAEGEQW